MSKRTSWAVRIERAEKRGKFLTRELVWAADWTSCAVGEKHQFPRKDTYSYKLPSDEEKLGVEFMYAVQSQDISEAKRVYAEIQALP